MSVVTVVVGLLAGSAWGRAGAVGPPVKRVRFRYVYAIVASGSMEPTIRCARPGPGCTGRSSDLILLEVSGARQVRRGDIISFLLPRAAKRFCGQGERGERVIGLPGDYVTEHEGVISVDGYPQDEPYVPARERDHRSGSWHVPRGTYFVMADNRKHSCDSRDWGPLTANRIQGRVVEIIRHVPRS